MIIEKPTGEKNIDDAELASIIRRKVAVAEQSAQDGNFEGASQAFKEAADASFELGEIEDAMHLLDRREDMIKQRVSPGPRILNYLAALQIKVDLAIKTVKYTQARDLLKQMLAIAEQGHDIIAIKSIKKQLDALQAIARR